MKTFLITLILFFIYHSGKAQIQNCPDCYKNPLLTRSPVIDCIDEYGTDMQNEIKTQRVHYEFYKTLRKIHEPSTVSSFTNWTFNNLGYQKKNFILDGDLNIPIAIQLSGKIGLNTLHIIPRFKFRIFQNDPDFPHSANGDASLPVRTPSAMPGIAYYWAHPNWWTDQEDKHIQNIYLGIYAYHHSNGQDGNELDTILVGEINTYNGNFGEDLVFEFIFGASKKFRSIQNDKWFGTEYNEKVGNYKLGKKLTLKPSTGHELHWRVGYEFHPKVVSNPVFDSLDMYGRHRLNISLSYLRLPKFWSFIGDNDEWCSIGPERNYEKWRHTLNISYILDNKYKRGNYLNPEVVSYFNLKRRLNISYTLYYVIGRSRFSALFAQVSYFGTDNYNIYFNNSLTSIRIGVAFGFFDQPHKSDLVSP